MLPVNTTCCQQKSSKRRGSNHTTVLAPGQTSRYRKYHCQNMKNKHTDQNTETINMLFWPLSRSYKREIKSRFWNYTFFLRACTRTAVPDYFLLVDVGSCRIIGCRWYICTQETKKIIKFVTRSWRETIIFSLANQNNFANATEHTQPHKYCPKFRSYVCFHCDHVYVQSGQLSQAC